MPDQVPHRRPHLVLQGTSEAKPFTAHTPNGGARAAVPDLDRQSHGAALRNQLRRLRPVAEAAKARQQEIGLESGIGIQIQFLSRPDADLAFERLASEGRGRGIELLSVQERDAKAVLANVFVPDGQLQHFERLITEYLESNTDRNGRPRDNRTLLNTIGGIRAAAIQGLWTDSPETLPDDVNEAFWWEVWIRRSRVLGAAVEDFRRLAAICQCVVSEAVVDFPERSVVVMFGSQAHFAQSVLALNCVAELRRAKDTADFFVGLGITEQLRWAEDLRSRLQAPAPDEGAPRICLLDSGVNRGHPLIEPLIAPDDLFTVNAAWGTDDTANHGTGLAGIAGYGDLYAALASNDPITIDHRLESVKLTPHQGANAGDDKHHASLFIDAVTTPEARFGQRKRVFSSAVTASDYRDFGRPSAWSATVDSLASDDNGEGAFPRLFILSAGNTNDPAQWAQYPNSVSLNQIHDPGQAWNALTVGAFTQKTAITELNTAHFNSVAPTDALSPFTSSSSMWDERAWPMKPDVIFEGGNAGTNGITTDNFASLELLTTNNRPLTRLFWTTNATSAAAALCARMAAQIMVAYPALRPETIRALVANSAEWTDAMQQMYAPAGARRTKQEFAKLIRHCGWGVPHLDRALWSVANSLSLVAEDVILPYKKDGYTIKTRDMNLHSLPWPKDQLEALQGTPVEMRVTLSYFVEPNPSARGSASKYHYPSHRLRFSVRRPLESLDDFQARINAAAAREEAGRMGAPADAHWILGDRLRHRGSLHQDIWRGAAADLASRGFLAVYPSSGWWRSRPAQERYDLPARYSLIVSIRTPEADVDLYTPIAQQVAAQAAVPVVVNT